MLSTWLVNMISSEKWSAPEDMNFNLTQTHRKCGCVCMRINLLRNAFSFALMRWAAMWWQQIIVICTKWRRRWRCRWRSVVMELATFSSCSNILLAQNLANRNQHLHQFTQFVHSFFTEEISCQQSFSLKIKENWNKFSSPTIFGGMIQPEWWMIFGLYWK